MSHVRSLAVFVAVGLPLLAAFGCNNQQSIIVPNRVLDRPLDAVLACVQDNGARMEVLSLNQCDGSNPGRCDIEGSPTPQLIGFVSNSERNEVAMFRRCDRQSAVVDLDPAAPGYNLIPAGTLPSAMTITTDSCQAVAANVGSCDFTLLDVPGLATYAINTEVDGDDDRPTPSTLVSTLIPRTSDGRPLAASPAAVVTVPTALSLAGMVEEPDDGGDDDGGDDETTDGGTTDGAADEGVDPAPEGTVCEGLRPASVYVTFPSCQLVAEVSLQTGAILQSRQLVTLPSGEVQLVDTGSTPVCPVDCPAQLDGDLPDEVELIDPRGVFPSALALVVPPGPDADVDEAEEQLTYAALFVGGPGSDRVLEIPIDEDGRFGVDSDALLLDDAQGVQKIRATPAADVLGDPHQFLYVIAGDGSTRVVDRDFDPGILGIECDTQIDPTLEAATACHPMTPGQNVEALDRRPFAVGPGIRAGPGATINDWSFHKVSVAEANATCGEPGPGNDRSRTPFCAPGIVGVGVTSVGTVVYASFGQYSADDAVSTAVDPVGVMQVQVRPHSLWPSVDPFALDPVPEALPLVADEEPGRALPGGGSDAQTLAPTLRRIDLAYSAEGDVSAQQQEISMALGSASNVDQLGSRVEGEALYDNPVPRAAVRDFSVWGAQTWTLEWEPTINGTTSSTGLLQCDDHGTVTEDAPGAGGQPGGTCLNDDPDDARLLDESANFCEDGVLAGDKLVVLGCTDDDTCGLGQRCLRDPTAPTTASGICVSAQAYDEARDELRAACGPFIRDACGSAQREYRITRATQDELWLAALDRPRRSVVRNMAGPDEAVELHEYVAKLSCDAPVRRVEAQTCTSDEDCLADPYSADNQRGDLSCDVDRGRCVGQQPDGGCDEDADCLGLGAQYLCVDATCRAPCDLCAPPAQPDEPCRVDDDCVAAGQVCIAGTCHEPCTDGNPGCLQSPLPGPLCFPELVRYTVRLHESFAFTGSNIGFLTDRVVANAEGECVEDPAVSSLLSSRIRVGADAESTFGTGPWQIADCVNREEARPGDPNPCRIVTERAVDPDSLFHAFRYRDEPVAAIRYSNPVMSVTIDLASLLGLATDPPDYPGQIWPPEFARFVRARIPDGYREQFSTQSGFIPFNEVVVVGGRTPMVYPVRILRGPEARSDFIVDAGGRGGTAGIRGQVIRISHSPGEVSTDSQFLVR